VASSCLRRMAALSPAGPRAGPTAVGEGPVLRLNLMKGLYIFGVHDGANFRGAKMGRKKVIPSLFCPHSTWVPKKWGLGTGGVWRGET